MADDKQHSRKGEEIDVDRIDLDKMRENTTDQPGLIPHPHTLGGAVIRPEDMGRVKGDAMQAMQEQTASQMGQLYDQMETLVKQADPLKKRVAISERIYQVKMGFQPKIGKVYFLYQRPDGTDFLSLVAPAEWGRSSTLVYIGQVRLLADHTWEVIDMPGETPIGG